MQHKVCVCVSPERSAPSLCPTWTKKMCQIYGSVEACCQHLYRNEKKAKKIHPLPQPTPSFLLHTLASSPSSVLSTQPLSSPHQPTHTPSTTATFFSMRVSICSLLFVFCSVGRSEDSKDGQIVAGEVVSEEVLLNTCRREGVSERCRRMMVEDLDVARQLAHMPMNSYDLYDACSLNRKNFPPFKSAMSQFKAQLKTGKHKAGLAIFIMLHECEEAQQLISRLLQDKQVYIAVHMDRSASRKDHLCMKQFVAHLSDQCSEDTGQVVYLEPRSDTEWGSWSMVEAELTAINHFAGLAPYWSHFLVMSGADYPLVHPSELVAFFKKHKGKSFYYDNEMTDSTRRLTLTELVTSCDGHVVHLGYRAEVPPPEYFVLSNTWKFFSREFILDLVHNRHGLRTLFEELTRLLYLTPSVDEMVLPTVHKHSMLHCAQRAEIHSRDFYTMYWPGDATDRECSPIITGSPLKWYCPKRPFSLRLEDFPRVPLGISLFTRKIGKGEARLKALIDSAADGSFAGVPHFLNTEGASLSNGIEVKLVNRRHHFAVRLVPGGGASTQADAMLWWGWEMRNEGEGSDFILSDCTGAPQEGTCFKRKEGGCFSSGIVEGFTPTFCRLRLKEKPDLCLSLHSETVKVNNLVGLSSCSKFLEPQIFHFRGHQMISASKVSLTQYNATGGLCVTRDPNKSGVESTPITPCSEQKTQQICVEIQSFP